MVGNFGGANFHGSQNKAELISQLKFCNSSPVQGHSTVPTNGLSNDVIDT